MNVGQEEVQLHSQLTLALDGMVVNYHTLLYAQDKTQLPTEQKAELTPGSVQTSGEKKKISWLCQDSKSGLCSSYPSHYTTNTILAPY
jgi:hypothetical protein